MSAYKATQEVLNGMSVGTEFTGTNLKLAVETIIPDAHYVSTYLRYLRYYNEDKIKIVCLHRIKSLYKKVCE